jgi:hypothetical protein
LCQDLRSWDPAFAPFTWFGELSRSFRSPVADELFASQRGDKATRSDEFLIGSR